MIPNTCDSLYNKIVTCDDFSKVYFIQCFENSSFFYVAGGSFQLLDLGRSCLLLQSRCSRTLLNFRCAGSQRVQALHRVDKALEADMLSQVHNFFTLQTSEKLDDEQKIRSSVDTPSRSGTEYSPIWFFYIFPIY